MPAPVTALLILCISVFMIAATAIGIQSYNNNSGWKSSHKMNFKFLVGALVCAILGVLASPVIFKFAP